MAEKKESKAKETKSSRIEVEVLDAVVDGKGQGEKIQIDEKSADYLEQIGYVKRV